MARHREHPIHAAQYQHDSHGSDGTGNPTIDTITGTTGTRPVRVELILKIWNEHLKRTLGYVTIFVDETLDSYLFIGLTYLALENNEYISYDLPGNEDFDIMKLKHKNTVTKVHYRGNEVADRVVGNNEELFSAAVGLLRDRGFSPFDCFQIWFTEDHLPVSPWRKFANFFRREKKGNKLWTKGKGQASAGQDASSAAGSSVGIEPLLIDMKDDSTDAEDSSGTWETVSSC